MNRPEWVERLEKERDELAARMHLLDKFLMEHDESEIEHPDLLHAQLWAMMNYSNIIERRLDCWEAGR
jgi:hypothetical protein